MVVQILRCLGKLTLLSDSRGLATCLQIEYYAQLLSSISVAMEDILSRNSEISDASHTNCHERAETTYQFHSTEISLQKKPHIPHRHSLEQFG